MHPTQAHYSSRRFLGACLAFAALLTLSACGAEADRAGAATPSAEAAAPADLSRIVTLGGAVTEIVYALGEGEAIVATDVSSTYPVGAREKARLGYYRQASAEGILSLAPTLIIATEGLGPPPVVQQLRAAGVRLLTVPEAETMEQAEARARAIGAALNRQAEAEALVQRVRDELAGAEALHPSDSPRALFVYARGAGLVSVSGGGTAADVVLGLAGARNAVTSFEGYKPLTAEAVVTANPDVLVIPERSMESIGRIDGLLAQPGLAQTTAGRARRVVAVDDALLLGLGPRLGEGVAALARGLAGLEADAASQAAALE